MRSWATINYLTHISQINFPSISNERKTADPTGAGKNAAGAFGGLARKTLRLSGRSSSRWRPGKMTCYFIKQNENKQNYKKSPSRSQVRNHVAAGFYRIALAIGILLLTKQHTNLSAQD